VAVEFLMTGVYLQVPAHFTLMVAPHQTKASYNSQEWSGADDSFGACVCEGVCVCGGQISHSPCLFLSREYSSRTFGCRARERPGTESADSSDFI